MPGIAKRLVTQRHEVDGIARNSVPPTAQRRWRYDLVVKYDVIVVGAGAAGTTLASRISEGARKSVMVLESGPNYPTMADMPDDLLNAHYGSCLAICSAFSNAGGRHVFPWDASSVVLQRSILRSHCTGSRRTTTSRWHWVTTSGLGTRCSRTSAAWRDDQDVQDDFHGRANNDWRACG